MWFISLTIFSKLPIFSATYTNFFVCLFIVVYSVDPIPYQENIADKTRLDTKHQWRGVWWCRDTQSFCYPVQSLTSIVFARASAFGRHSLRQIMTNRGPKHWCGTRRTHLPVQKHGRWTRKKKAFLLFGHTFFFLRWSKTENCLASVVIDLYPSHSTKHPSKKKGT